MRMYFTVYTVYIVSECGPCLIGASHQVVVRIVTTNHPFSPFRREVLVVLARWCSAVHSESGLRPTQPLSCQGADSCLV